MDLWFIVRVRVKVRLRVRVMVMVRLRVRVRVRVLGSFGLLGLRFRIWGLIVMVQLLLFWFSYFGLRA